MKSIVESQVVSILEIKPPPYSGSD